MSNDKDSTSPVESFKAQMDREAVWRRMRLDQVYSQYEELRSSFPLLEKKSVPKKGGPSTQFQLHVDLGKVKKEKGKGVAAIGVRGREEHVFVSDRAIKYQPLKSSKERN